MIFVIVHIPFVSLIMESVGLANHRIHILIPNNRYVCPYIHDTFFFSPTLLLPRVTVVQLVQPEENRGHGGWTSFISRPETGSVTIVTRNVVTDYVLCVCI